MPATDPVATRTDPVSIEVEYSCPSIPFEVCDPKQAPAEFDPAVVAALYPMVPHLRAGKAIRTNLYPFEANNIEAPTTWILSSPAFFRRLGIEVYVRKVRDELSVYWIVPIANPQSKGLKADG